MEIKPYWVMVAGFVLILVFALYLVSTGYRHPHWLMSYSYRPGSGSSRGLLGPGGTRQLLGFEGFASASDATFTLFGTSWCGHCKQARPLMESLGSKVTIGDKAVALRFVDCDTEKEATQGYQIDGYPTYYLDYAGQRTKYTGGRDPQSIQAFLQQQLSA
jgi:thiol-disulfide isomerase/thioredoxin